MQYLTRSNAQRIADRIMEVVPHNINIMDNRGVIIASGDKTRIGIQHQGALKVLELRDAYCVREDTATERKGINLPIFYNGSLAGVIGISGDVDAVLQLGQLAVTTAQLMIENDAVNEKSAISKNRLYNFYFEWTHREPKDYTDAFLEQAAYFHVDLNRPRVAVLIPLRRPRYRLIDQIISLLGPEDHLVLQSLSSLTLLLDDAPGFTQRIEQIMALDKDLENAFVSDSCTVAAQAVAHVHWLSQVAHGLQVPWRIVYHSQLVLETLLSALPPDPMIATITDRLAQGEGTDGLRLTILNYVECSDDLHKVCEKLYIHRNTLNYRIEKIRKLTGLNLKNGKDMMILYLAALQSSMKLSRGKAKPAGEKQTQK